MKRLTSLLAALFLLLASTTWSQQLSKRITDKDIIDMTALGLSDDVIIAKIRAAAGGTLQFDTSVDGLKELKAAKEESTTSESRTDRAELAQLKIWVPHLRAVSSR